MSYTPERNQLEPYGVISAPTIDTRRSSRDWLGRKALASAISISAALAGCSSSASKTPAVPTTPATPTWSYSAPTLFVNFADIEGSKDNETALEYRECPGNNNELIKEQKNTAAPLIAPNGCIDMVFFVSNSIANNLGPAMLVQPGDPAYPVSSESPTPTN